MTINKFQGKTKEEAIDKAKQEMGTNAVIMNVREIKPRGFFSVFKSSTFEVTAALEEKDAVVTPFSALKSPQKLHDNINFSADEKIELPKPSRVEEQILPQTEEGKIQTDTVKLQPKNVNVRRSQLIQETEESNLEKRLDDLSNMLEEKLGGNAKEEVEDKTMSFEQLDFALRVSAVS